MLPENIIDDMCNTLQHDLEKPNTSKQYCNPEYKYRTRILGKMCPELEKKIEKSIINKCTNWCELLAKKDVKAMPNWSWFVLMFILLITLIVYHYDPYNNWCK